MAWPLSRMLDFVSESVPQIPEWFLNALQDAQIAFASGTQSIKALVVDGVGGVASTPTAGWIYGKVLRVTQALGTGTAAAGDLYPELVPYALASINGGNAGGAVDPTLVQKVNVASVARIGGAAGQYRLVTKGCPARLAGLADGTAVYPVVVATTHGSSQAVRVDCTKESSGGSQYLKIDLNINTDSYITVAVFP